MLYSNYFIDRLRARDPQSVALVEANGTPLSCGQLLEQSMRLAAGLSAAGLGPGSRVVVAAAPGADFLRLIYATMLLRAQVSIIDPEMGRDNYAAKFRQFAPEWAFVDYRLLLLREHPLLRWLYFRLKPRGAYFPGAPGLKIVATGRWLPIVRQHQSLRRLVQTPVDRTAVLQDTAEPGTPEFSLITYTSGTLAEPKGVVHTLETIGESIRLLAGLLTETPGQRIATFVPHYMLIGVTAGVPVYEWAPGLDSPAKIQFIEKHSITTLFGPPVEYRPLVEWCKTEARALPGSLRLLMSGSAPVHAAFLEQLLPLVPESCRVLAMYGMTENLLVALADGREKVRRNTPGDWLGHPAAGLELKVSPDGEILLRSPQLFQGYYKMPPRDDWHPSGDLGRIEADGSLTLTGRKKDMIIRRNFNLYPALYEPTLNKIPGVTEAVLVGVYDQIRHDEIVFLVVEAAAPLTEASIRRAFQQGPFQIDAEAQPDRVVFRTLPRKGRQFKVDRVALRQWLAETYSITPSGKP